MCRAVARVRLRPGVRRLRYRTARKLLPVDLIPGVRGQYEVRTFMSGATLCQGANAKFTSIYFYLLHHVSLTLDLF